MLLTSQSSISGSYCTKKRMKSSTIWSHYLMHRVMANSHWIYHILWRWSFSTSIVLSWLDAWYHSTNKVTTWHISWYKRCLHNRSRGRRWRWCTVTVCFARITGHKFSSLGIWFWHCRPYVFKLSDHFCHSRPSLWLIFATLHGQSQKFLHMLRWIRAHSSIDNWKYHARLVCNVHLKKIRISDIVKHSIIFWVNLGIPWLKVRG